MILKLLLVVGVIGIVYFIFIKKKPLQSNENNRSQNKEPESNDMVECATCGVYVEIGDSILSNGKYYCSNECLKES
jgi:uncharacterized protein